MSLPFPEPFVESKRIAVEYRIVENPEKPGIGPRKPHQQVASIQRSTQAAQLAITEFRRVERHYSPVVLVKNFSTPTTNFFVNHPNLPLCLIVKQLGRQTPSLVQPEHQPSLELEF